MRITPQHDSRTDGEWMDPDRTRFRVDGTVRSECRWSKGRRIRRADDPLPRFTIILSDCGLRVRSSEEVSLLLHYPAAVLPDLH